MPASPHHPSLAGHLSRAVAQWPEQIAIRHGEKALNWRDWQAHVRALAIALPEDDGPLVAYGDSLHLAGLAFACALKNRPFWPVDGQRPTRPENPPADTALIIRTSGSEGIPKAVCLGGQQLDAAAAAVNDCLDLRPGDLWLHCLPLFHIGGQAILWRCTRVGAGIVLHDRFDVEAIAADLAGKPITHLSLVPAMLARLLDAGITPPASLRVALIGGAALSHALYERAIAAGWPLVASYGMSETAALIAAHRPSDGAWQPGLAGRLLPGHVARIDDAGRICLRGPQIMTRYLDGSGPDGDGWLITGDLGEIDHTGRLTVLGRADDMLVCGGNKIHPLTVEGCLAELPGVRDVAVSSRPDPAWGDRPVAFIVGEVAAADLLEHATRHLPGFACPREIHRLTALPRNAAGKLDRIALRALLAAAAPA